MRFSTTSRLFALIDIFAVSASLHASPLVDRWTFAGGGLDPENYLSQPSQFRPTPIKPDAAFGANATSTSATIVVTGLSFTPEGSPFPISSGGLGSATFGAFQGIYTSNAFNPSFVLSTSNILGGLDEITISLTVGGGDPPPLLSYLSNSLTLNYNASNNQLASTTFTSFALPEIEVPEGPFESLPLTIYTWKWTGLATLGPTTQFSTQWDVDEKQRVFFQEISLTQAIPEPSTVALIAISGAFCLLRHRRR